MYNSTEKAIIFIDGFINLEYKHKRAIINLYEDIEDLFDNPNPAFDYLKEMLKDGYYESQVSKYKKYLEGINNKHMINKNNILLIYFQEFHLYL